MSNIGGRVICACWRAGYRVDATSTEQQAASSKERAARRVRATGREQGEYIAIEAETERGESGTKRSKSRGYVGWLMVGVASSVTPCTHIYELHINDTKTRLIQIYN